MRAASNAVQRTAAVVSAEDAIAMLEPGDILIDCTGSKSLLRDHLAPRLRRGGWRQRTRSTSGSNTRSSSRSCTARRTTATSTASTTRTSRTRTTSSFRWSTARTHDGSISHVTGIVNITAEDYEAMPSRFDGEWLRSNFPDVAQSMDRFIDKIKQETHGEMLGDLEIRPDTPGSVPGPQCDQPAVAHDGAQRPPLRQLAGIPRRRFGNWLSVLSVDFAWLRVCDVPGGTHRAA